MRQINTVQSKMIATCIKIELNLFSDLRVEDLSQTQGKE